MAVVCPRSQKRRTSTKPAVSNCMNHFGRQLVRSGQLPPADPARHGLPTQALLLLSCFRPHGHASHSFPRMQLAVEPSSSGNPANSPRQPASPAGLTKSPRREPSPVALACRPRQEPSPGPLARTPRQPASPASPARNPRQDLPPASLACKPRQEPSPGSKPCCRQLSSPAAL